MFLYSKESQEPGTGWKIISDPGTGIGSILSSDPNPGGGYIKDPGTGMGSTLNFDTETGI
ncbi:hypothetical protein J4P91_10165 [Bacillus sp. XF8]|nr:hypothetical protein [Bacillus sp. XF8]